MDDQKKRIRTRINVKIDTVTYILEKPSRFDLDAWERKWKIQRYLGKMGMFMLRRERLDSLSEVGKIDALQLKSKITEYDNEISKVEDIFASEVDIGEDHKATYGIVARAELLAMCSVLESGEKARSMMEWLEEDVTIFNILTKCLEEFIFDVGEKQKDFYTELVTKIKSMDPDKPLTVKEFVGILEESYEQNLEEDGTKKKSSGAYVVSTSPA